MAGTPKNTVQNIARMSEIGFSHSLSLKPYENINEMKKPMYILTGKMLNGRKSANPLLQDFTRFQRKFSSKELLTLPIMYY